MDLVDEEHVVALQVGQQRRQVFGLFEHRAGSLAQVDAQLGRDDVTQRGLAQAGRAEKQDVVKRLIAHARRADKNFKLLAHFRLADVFVEQLGAQGALDRLFVWRSGSCRHHALRGGGEIVGLNSHGAASWKRSLVGPRRVPSASKTPRTTPIWPTPSALA